VGIKVAVKSREFKRALELVPKRINWRPMAKVIKNEVLKDIKGGRSPVSGGRRRYQRYSNSYRGKIKAEVAFLTNKKTGGVQTIRYDDNKEVADAKSAFEAAQKAARNTRFTGGSFFGKEAKKAKSKLTRQGKKYIRSLDPDFYKHKKRPAPVNLTLSGKMLRSVFTRVFNKLALIQIGFKDEKSVYHDEGTDNIPQRKMLPRRPKELFNKSIQLKIANNLKKLLSKIQI
jgi:phage gpG-like protein